MNQTPKKVNPFCPVPGCRTKAPHLDDPTVAGLVHNFSDPAKVAQWTMASIAELGNSILADLEAGRKFALITRSRQLEELYIRALYALFVATPDEIPHIMSDATPNSFILMYRAVNKLVYEGRGILEMKHPDLKHGEFTAMGTINSAAHASFSTMMQVIALARNPEYFEAYSSGRYFNHIHVYCSHLNEAHKMFAAGKDKSAVLSALINMHRPNAYWAAQAQAQALFEESKKKKEEADVKK